MRLGFGNSIQIQIIFTIELQCLIDNCVLINLIITFDVAWWPDSHQTHVMNAINTSDGKPEWLVIHISLSSSINSSSIESMPSEKYE